MAAAANERLHRFPGRRRRRRSSAATWAVGILDQAGDDGAELLNLDRDVAERARGLIADDRQARRTHHRPARFRGGGGRRACRERRADAQKAVEAGQPCGMTDRRT